LQYVCLYVYFIQVDEVLISEVLR